MSRSLRAQDLTWFLDMFEKGQLDLDPPYQRRSVWSPNDKRFFIDTIMNGYPAPPVFLHKTMDENGRSTYHVVDGKQRLLAIIDFTRNRIPIPDDFADARLRKKKWNDLSTEDRTKFWNYELIVEMLPDVTETAVRDIFDRINRNARKLTRQELRHAKYEGWFAKTAEAESEKDEWKRFGVVTTARAKRMDDVQILSELIIVTISRSLHGFDQDALDGFYADFDDLANQPMFVEDEFTTRFEETKDFIRRIIEIEPALLEYLRVTAHLYSLWGCLTVGARDQPVQSSFASSYLEFLRAVESWSVQFKTETGDLLSSVSQGLEVRYALNFVGASTDLSQRQARHDALVAAVLGAGSDQDEDQ